MLIIVDLQEVQLQSGTCNESMGDIADQVILTVKWQTFVSCQYVTHIHHASIYDTYLL